jgi:stearoyl-CoA desaturase (delta-9 desaturase)
MDPERSLENPAAEPARLRGTGTPPAAPPPKKLDPVNTGFLLVVHLIGVAAIVYSVFNFSWWTLGLGVLWFAFCGISVTGGYHRLFAHPTYKAHPLLRAFYLFFGAASVQNSALKWSADHRVHHSRTDTNDDPYNIRRGFWWAHIGWVFFWEGNTDTSTVKDLAKDPLIAFQDRYYVPLAVVSGALLPACLGLLWGDFLGALLVAGALRLVVQWHATFAVNSFTHMFGSQPYCKTGSARDSGLVALITLGEGYHNYHHRFPIDYRNGVRWWQFDPTKWFVWTLSKVGLTRDLRRTPADRMEAVRRQVAAVSAES